MTREEEARTWVVCLLAFFVPAWLWVGGSFLWWSDYAEHVFRFVSRLSLMALPFFLVFSVRFLQDRFTPERS